MKKVLMKCYSKINISLKVVGTRDDGYHELDMVMLPVLLHDSILMTELPNGMDHYVTMDDFSITNVDDNVATKAINLFEEKFNIEKKFKLDIHKVVPSKAGMGGGSSDAAFTLKGLNKYLGVGATIEELEDLALKLGSDVPFFIRCVPARCTGRGEIIKPITVKNDYYVMIVKPSFGCKTVNVYNQYDQMEIQSGNIDNVVKALETGDDDLLQESLFNDLEEPAFTLFPKIREIKKTLHDMGLKMSLMTGSGSCVFALSQSKKDFKKAANYLEDKGYRVIITKVLKSE